MFNDVFPCTNPLDSDFIFNRLELSTFMIVKKIK